MGYGSCGRVGQDGAAAGARGGHGYSRVVRDGPRALLDVRAVRAGIKEVDEVCLRAVHYKVKAKALQ